MSEAAREWIRSYPEDDPVAAIIAMPDDIPW